MRLNYNIHTGEQKRNFKVSIIEVTVIWEDIMNEEIWGMNQ